MKVRGINFSSEYVRGSVETRKNTVEQICSKLFDAVMCEYKPYKTDKGLSMERTEVPYTKIEEVLKNNMPEFANFYITKNIKPNEYAGCVKNVFDINKIKNYRMELLVKNKNLSKEEVPTLMHEITHLLDCLVNPQYRVLNENLSEIGLLKETSKFYRDVYYAEKDFSDKQLLKQTKKFLKDCTSDEKLLILRYIKLNMLSEINAYNASKNYSKELKKSLNYISNYVSQKEMLLNRRVREYRFKEKIDLVDKMRYKVIKKERNKNKRQSFLDKIFGKNC